MKSNKRGFTLIELLVVIAIIGILAAIVLVSLRGATAKARDARIASAFSQLRTSVELFSADNNGAYNGSNPATLQTICQNTNCSAYTANSPANNICTLCAEIANQNGGTRPTFQASDSEYCAYARVASDANRYFCIDEGRAYEGTTNPATSHCNATMRNCP